MSRQPFGNALQVRLGALAVTLYVISLTAASSAQELKDVQELDITLIDGPSPHTAPVWDRAWRDDPGGRI